MCSVLFFPQEKFALLLVSIAACCAHFLRQKWKTEIKRIATKHIMPLRPAPSASSLQLCHLLAVFKEKDENPTVSYCKDLVQWFKESTEEIFKALIFVFLKEFC